MRKLLIVFLLLQGVFAVEAATPQLKVTFEGHTDGVDSVAFNPDSNTLVSGSRDSTIRFWDIEKGEPIAVLQEGTGRVRTIAFSPDGNTLASGSGDNTVRLWEFTRSDDEISAIDTKEAQIYWIEGSYQIVDSGAWIQGKIQYANLDGTNVQDLVTGLDSKDIALDVAGDKIYWTDFRQGKIQCANLDGTNVQDLVTGLSSPQAIALAIPLDLPPARADVNQDGQVNIIDLLLVVSTLGDTAPALPFGDVNEDNRVTIDDVLLVIEALDDPLTAAAPSNSGRILPLNDGTLEAHLNRLRSHSDGSLKYRRAITFFQNLLASVAPPDKTELLANYPNPFNPETWIPYRLAEDGFVTLTIYDGSGRVVRTIEVGHRIASAYESRSKAIYWDGKNGLGEPVASGVYFYHLSAGAYSAMRRMVILK